MQNKNRRPLILVVFFVFFAEATMMSGQMYTLEVEGTDRLKITDSRGNTNKRISDSADIAVPGVDYQYGSAPNDTEISPHIATFLDNMTVDVKFRTASAEVSSITITRGRGQGHGAYTTMLIRYLDFADLGIPANVTAWIRFSGQGVSDLKLDKDGDGVFETTIKPQFSIEGRAAKDTVRPSVDVSVERSGAFAMLTMTAIDTDSGVKYIQYQIGDGNPVHQIYTGPFKVDISKPVNVWAIAADMAGNRAVAAKAFGSDPKTKPGSDPYKLRSIPF